MGYWTTIDHDIRKKFDLSLNEYAVADSIYTLSRSGWCTASREHLGDFIGVSRQTVTTIINLLVDRDIVEKDNKRGLRTTEKWDDAFLKTKNNRRGSESQSGQKCKESLHLEEKECKESLHNCKESLHQNGQKCKESLHNCKESLHNIYSISTDNDNNSIIRLTQLLYDLIQKYVNPPTWKSRPPDLNVWYKDIEKLHRIDAVPAEDIEDVINWVVRDKFWSGNILSGGTLRKQYDRLFLQMNKNRRGKVVSLDENRGLVEKIKKRQEMQNEVR